MQFLKANEEKLTRALDASVDEFMKNIKVNIRLMRLFNRDKIKV